MRTTTHAAIAALIDHVEASLPEIRERCAETTAQKLQALAIDVQNLAAEEGTHAAVGAVPADAEAIAAAVREHLALDVSSAVSEAFDARNIPAAA